MVIVFDLDDTLYPELAFVKSGFKAVADYLSPLMGLSQKQIFQALNDELSMRREEVFNRFLLKHGLYTQRLLKACIRIYRGHQPTLHLFPEASTCLARLQSYPLYIVTDGNHLVQRKKVLALGLKRLVRQCFFTYAHGLHRRKPSPYCFEKICRLEHVFPSSVVYIADNPHKDFVGIKPLGFQTIRVLTGPYRDDRVDEAYDAHLTIPHLKLVDEQLLEHLKHICKQKGNK